MEHSLGTVKLHKGLLPYISRSLLWALKKLRKGLLPALPYTEIQQQYLFGPGRKEGDRKQISGQQDDRFIQEYEHVQHTPDSAKVAR